MFSDIETRVAAIDWVALARSLDSDGNAVVKSLLNQDECCALADLYDVEGIYRSRVVMGRHGFGRGEYKYFSYPLPSPVARLRAAIYPGLVPVANRWNALMRNPVRFPDGHQEFLERCHDAGQVRPTPLILRYTSEDYNCLHQDLYGEHVFPLQLAILLARPGEDFTGGEFVMTQTGRTDSAAQVLSLKQGDAAIIAVNQRPAIGPAGRGRVAMRHGVSKLRSGTRHTVGIIFHDAA